MLTRETLISIYDAAASENAGLYDEPAAPMMGRVAGVIAVEDALGVQLESREIDACQTVAEIVEIAVRKVGLTKPGVLTN